MVLFELITIGKAAKSILGSKAIYMFINRLNFSELLYLYTYHIMPCFPSYVLSVALVGISFLFLVTHR